MATPETAQGPQAKKFIIHAETLIPGRGEPIKNASVAVQSGKIAWVGKTSSVPAEFQGWASHSVPVVMPGMWDCHVHLLGWTSMKPSAGIVEHDIVLGSRLAFSLADTINSGFTTVRDVGGFGTELSSAVADGSLPIAPHIYSAGSCISQTAGHGDAFDLPLEWIQSKCGVGGAKCGGISILADGVDECRKAVRQQLRRGAKCIKVFASGGVLSLRDDPMHSQYSSEELRVVVEEANRAGRSVAAHAHGRNAILAAVEAGCKTIEHGTFLDEDCANAMIEKDLLLVPTRTIILEGLKNKHMMAPESCIKLADTEARNADACRLAIQRGVKIALGTDLGLGPRGSGLAHGKSGGELSHLVDLGMTPLQAIEAATATAPETLGEQAPKSGQLVQGFDADIIALSEDPLRDIKVLQDSGTVTHVWKCGDILKSPSVTQE